MKTKLFAIILILSGLSIFASESYGCGGGNYPPVADLVAEPNYAAVGENVILDGSGSYDPDGSITKYEWDFTSDGTYDYYETSGYHPDGAFDGNTTHAYSEPNTYTAMLRVTDNLGATDTDNTCTVYVVKIKNITQGTIHSTIQSALDDANNGDTIKVAEGNYYETIDFNGVSCTLTSIDPNDWDVVAATIIDANGSNSVVTFGSNEDANSVLRGFTITGGGVGIYCDGASPTISNCIIRENGSGDDLGGGMYDCNGSPTVTDCFFVENDANLGGGIYDFNSTAEISNCIFSRNDANYGGAIYDCNSSPTLTNCTLTQNHAQVKGGGMYCLGSLSEANLTNCILWNNYADISNDQILISSSADPNFSYCNIEGSGGSSNWDSDFGTDGGGNIDEDPLFVVWEPTQDIVAYWDFDEGYETTAHDWLGVSDGNIVDANWADGQIDYALSFDGDGDYVDCSNDVSISNLSTFSVSVWFKTDYIPAGGGYPYMICQRDLSNVVWAFLLHGDFSGKISANVMTDGTNAASVGDFVPSVGQWYHAVMTYDDNGDRKTRLYIDGSECSYNQQDTATGTMSSNSSVHVAIGNRMGGGRDWDGLIDEVSIYNKILSSREIEQLYQYGIVGHYDYHLDEDSPCINAGDPNGSYENQTDIDGYARIQGGCVDMGAYEYAGVYSDSQDVYYFNIQEAINEANSGDTITLFPGTYYETIDFNGVSCTIRSTDPNDPNIVAATIINGNGAGFAITFDANEDANSILEGITITGADTGIFLDDSSPVIKKCVIANNTDVGISCGSEAEPNIIDCTIYGSRDGIVCYPNSAPTIAFSDIYDNSDNGIISIMATPTISHNILYDNSQGITYIGYTSESLANNTIVNNSCYGITSLGCQDPAINNCILWGNGTDLDSTDANYSCIEDSSSGTGNISYFPYFTDADNDDFHLLSYSPCIDLGDPCSIYSNEPSPNGSRINMGAYGNTTEATSISANTDGDNLPDDWENAYLGGLSEGDGNDTTDNDDANNIVEYRRGTRPDLSDTDGDGMPDGWEINYGLDPLDPSDAAGDLDGDEKTNLQEYQSGSDPNASDIINVPNDYSTIQAAINACSQDWDIVEIEPNTYSGTGNINLDFGGKKITVRSKYPSNRAVIDCNGSVSDPNRGFYFHSGEGADSVVSGLVIINGYGKLVASDYVGGAIYCTNSSPTITNCQLSGNFATKGGAVYDSNCSPTIISCHFIDNDANSGGAIYNEDSNTVLTNCAFNYNWAIDSNGGAIYNDANSDPILTNCTFASNLAENGDGGGVYNETGSSPVLTNCILWGNRDGGDIYLMEDFDSGDCSSANFGSSCYTDWTVVDEGTTGSSSWSVDTGILKQSSDVYDSTEPNKHGTFVYYEQGSSWTDYRINMEIESASSEDDAIGVMFRYQDPNNYYRFSWDKEREYRRLVKCVNGTFTILVEDQVAYTSAQTYELEIVADGNELEISIDDELVLSATDSSLSSGSIALYCWDNSNAEFDNIIVSNPQRTGKGEYAQIYGGSPDVMYSCIQDNNPDDTYIPFGGQVNGNIDDDPKFTNWVPAYGLVAHWKLNEDAANKTVLDATANNHDGLTQTDNTEDLTTTGKVGACLDFGGADAVVITNDHNELSFGDGTNDSPFSISAWVYATTYAFAQTIFSKADVDGDNEYALYSYGTSDLRFYLHDDSAGANQRVIYRSLLTVGWHHIVATYDGRGESGVDPKNGMNLYVDGSLVEVSRLHTGTYVSMENTTTKCTIGARADGAGADYYWQDKIDNVVLFNEALSQAEIEALYVYGLQLSFNSPCIDVGDDDTVENNVTTDVLGDERFLDGDNDGTTAVDMGAYEFDWEKWFAPDRVSYWKLDEGSGAAAYDSASNNDGTVYGGASWVTGRFDGALSFDGTDYVEVSTDSNLDPSGHPFTVSMWIKRDNSSTWHGCFGQSYGAREIWYGGKYQQTKMSYFLETTEYVGSRTLSNDNWHHVAFTYQNPGQLRGYIDGVLDLNINSTKTIQANKTFIGAGADVGPVNTFDGTIDEVMVFDRALDAGEIVALAGNRAPVLATIGDKTAVEEKLLTFRLEATDADGDDLSYSSPNLPDDAMLDDNVFSWIAESNQIGDHNVTFIVSDGEFEDTETIKIEVVEESLAAYWNFDETSLNIAHDDVNGNDGTVYGIPWTNGKVGNGLSFDDQYAVEVDDNDVFSFGNGSSDSAFSISAWVFVTTSANIQTILGKWSANSKREWILTLQTNKVVRLRLADQSVAKYPYRDTDAALSDGWHFVCATYAGQSADGNNAASYITLYVDGVAVDSTAVEDAGYDAMENLAAKVSIGASYDGADVLRTYWDDKIDEVLVFDRALSAQEVDDIYDNGVNGVNGLTGFDEPNYPVSYWDCNEGSRNIVHDLVGDNNGVIVGMPWTEGKTGGGLDFDGAGDYVEVADNSSLDMTTELTVSLWMKRLELAANKALVVKWDFQTQGCWAFQIDNQDSDELRVFTATALDDNGSGGYGKTASANLIAGSWYHVTFVYDGDGTINADRLKIYVNGIEETLSFSGTIPSSLQNSSASVKIGKFGGTLDRYFNGTIDEVLIFDRALEVNEVNDIYQNGLDDVNALTGFDEPNYPVSYWELGETGGSTAYDSVGSNNGALKGDLNVAGPETGPVNNALNFSGDADYVAISDMNGAYYSIGFWAKFTATSSWERIVDFGGTNPFILSRNGTTSQMAYKNGSTWIYSDTGFIINDEWHHYAVVQIIDELGNRVIFYRDGIQYGKTKTSTETPTTDSRTSCYIGSAGSSNYFTGLLDELRIYERSLAEEEVEQLATNLNHPVLTTIGDRSVDVNSLLTFTVHANDIDGDTLTYSASGLPSGATFNNCTFSWIPYDGQEGNYEVTFTANDGEFDDSETINITVSDFNSSPQGVSKAVSGGLGNDLNLQVDPFTGGVRYSVPIVVPPGRQGSEPSISLNYSGGGDGWCGFGWSLGMGVIQRNTRYGVPVKLQNGQYLNEYDDDKGFVVSFGSINSRLVLVDDTNNVYRAETDQAFLKYVFDSNQWIVTDKSGNKFYFSEVEGETPSETVGICMKHPDFNSADSNNIFLWALAKIIDISGNTTYLEYTSDNGQIYLERIRYNGNIKDSPNPAITATHTVDFVLEDRPDESLSFATGFKVETKKRLSEIIVEVNDVHVRRYKLAYKTSPSSKRSLLSSVTVFDSDNVTSLPPLVFEYQTNPFEFGEVQDWGPLDSQGYTGNDANGRKWNSPSATTDNHDTILDLLDINGDGLPDRVMRKKDSPYTVFKVQLNTGNGFEQDENGDYVTRDWSPVKTQGNDANAAWGSVQAMDDDGNDAHVMLFDIDGDGLPDHIMRNDVSNYADPENVFKVQLNTGSGFETLTRHWTDVNSQGNNTDKGWNSPHGSDSDGTQVTMCDLNGDGLPDRVMRNNSSSFAEPNNIYKVQLNNGDGTFADVMNWGPLDAQGYTSNDGSGRKWNSPNAKNSNADQDNIVSLLDINGDGLPDRVMRKKDSAFTVFKVQYNTGYGFEKDGNDPNVPVTTDWGPLYTQGHDTDNAWGSIQAIDIEGAHVMFFDISADGLPDRVMRNDVSNYADPENVFKVQLNTGSGFETLARNWKNIDNQGQNTDKSWNSPYGSDSDGVQVFLCDINGDGLPDRVMRNKTASNYTAPENVFKVQLNKGDVPDLLKKVTSKLGGSVEVTYTPSTAYDNTDDTGKNLLPFPIQTASTVTIKDGLGTESTTTYDYSRGFFDTDEREFRGFGRVEITDPLGTKSVTYFHQGGGYDDNENGEFEDDDSVAKKGMPYCVEIYGSDGLLYSRTISKVEEVEVDPNTEWYFAYTSQTIKTDYEGLDDYRAKVRQSEYDPNTGNILKSSDLGEVEDINITSHSFTDIANDSLFIHTTYETFNDPNILNKIKDSKTTSDSNGSNVLKQIFFTYDANVGRVLKKETWLDTNDCNIAVEYEYDQYGNKIKTIDEVNIITDIEYDSTYRMFPIKKTTGSFVTETTYDVNSGLPVTTKDVMGISIKNVYDQFYRLTDIYISTEPNGDPNLWLTNIEYCLGGITDGNTSNNFIRQRFNGYEAYTYNDGLGRIIQSRTKAEDSAPYEYRVIDKCYDVRGKVSYVTTPFFDDGYDFSAWDPNRLGVLTEYDPVGRVYQVTPSDDDVKSPMGPATMAYTDGADPWCQVSTDPLGKVKKRYYDAKGRVINLVEVITDGNDCETKYTYDTLGRLTDTNDPAGNVIKASYDSFGRKTDTNDPDMGYWTYTYDDAGRMTEQTNSRGNTIKLVYEPNELGRLEEKKIYDSNDTLIDTITYYCDTGDADHTVYKGLIFKVEDKEGWVKTGYDSRGRAIKTTRHITETDSNYVTLTSYDDADRVTTITYPGNVAVINYDYGSAGELIRVRSTSGTGANETFYQPQGFTETGQITGIKYGNSTRTEYEYYTNSKRLKRIYTYQSWDDLLDLTYTFDKASNIKSITDNAYNGGPSSGLSNIQYDDLYRLTSLYSVSKAKTITYTYNAIGNILTNNDYGTGTYLYQGSGHAYSQPHAVTSANGKSYTYDQCGNMITRGNQVLTYDEENRLIDVNDSTAGIDVSFGYAYNGSRLYKKNNNTSTVTQLWIGGIYEEKYDAVRDANLILCHVYAGGDLIATFEPEGYGRWAVLIQKIPFAPQFCDITGKTYAGLFRGGRAPVSLMGMSILTGLALGMYYNRRRLWTKYGLASPNGLFGTSDPWRQMIILMIMTACILAGFPQEAFADAPAYDPVFYYYHTDHLGSSMVMTNRDGELVQHYGYTAFGYERYKHNTNAFDVTNRYTGQQLDEDTGLYFYKSRYYDPELARFTQADTVVPSANTSQALNRYSYVKNNPLKFSDPSGHGWFSKIWKRYIKPYIGIIVTVALNVLLPGLGIIAASLIGSAVGTLVNGGNFKSFAIGVGIGIAAGVVAGAVGGVLAGSSTGWETFVKAGWQGAAMSAAMYGAAGGAISSAVYGQNIEKGLAYGAIGGLTGLAVAAVTSAAISFGKSVIQELSNNISMEMEPMAYKPDFEYKPIGEMAAVNFLEKFDLHVADPTDFSWDAYGQIIPNPDPWDLSWVLPDEGFTDRFVADFYRYRLPGADNMILGSMLSLPLGPPAALAVNQGAKFAERTAYRQAWKNATFSGSGKFLYIAGKKPGMQLLSKGIGRASVVPLCTSTFYTAYDVGSAARATVTAWKK